MVGYCIVVTKERIKADPVMADAVANRKIHLLNPDGPLIIFEGRLALIKVRHVHKGTRKPCLQVYREYPGTEILGKKNEKTASAEIATRSKTVDADKKTIVARILRSTEKMKVTIARNGEENANKENVKNLNPSCTK